MPTKSSNKCDKSCGKLYECDPENGWSSDWDEIENCEDFEWEQHSFLVPGNLGSPVKTQRKHVPNRPSYFNKVFVGNVFNYKGSKKRFVYYAFFVILFVVITHAMLLYSQPNRIYAVAGWEPNVPRDVSQYVLPARNTTVRDVVSICTDDDDIFLLVVVCSAASNFEAR